MKRAIFFLIIILNSATLKSQVIISDTVIDINCYHSGAIYTNISSLDTNVFSKWYYSSSLSSSWDLLDTMSLDVFLNKSNFNSDSIITLLCGFYKLEIVDIVDTLIHDSIYYVGCDLSLETQVEIIQCHEEYGLINIDTFYLGGVPPYFFTWYYNNNLMNDTSWFIDSLSSGIYRVIVSDSLGCSDSVSDILNNPDNFTIDTIIIDNLGCYQDSTGELFISILGGRKISSTHRYNYYLLNNNDTIRECSDNYISQHIQYNPLALSISSTFRDSVIITNLFSDTFRLVVMDSSFCIIDTLIYIDQPDAYSLYYSSNNLPRTCSSDTSWFFIDSIIGGYFPFSYWIEDSLDVRHISSALINDSIYLPGGEYSVYVHDTINNCKDTLPFSISFLYNIHIDVTTNHISCYGLGDGSIFIDSIYGGTYPYNFNSLTMINDSLELGIYYLDLIDSNSCIFKDSFLIDQPDSIIVDVNIQEPLCNGFDDGVIILNISGGIPSYIVNWNNGQITDTLSSVDAGDYFFEIIDANNCTYSDSILVVDPDPIELEFITYTDSLYCLGDSTFIKVVISGYDSSYSVIWSNNSIIDSTYIFSGLNFCYVVDNNTCFNTDSIYIYQPDTFKINDLVILDTICNDGVSAFVEIFGGTSPINYFWNTNDTTKSVMVNDSISVVWVVANDACFNTDSIGLYITPFILETSLNYNDSSKIATIDIINTTSNGPFNYLWNNLRIDSISLDSFLIVNPCEKRYYVSTINSINGCLVIDTLDLTSYLPENLFDLSNSSILPDSMLWGFSPYKYFWSSGHITQKAIICPGSYWVEVTDNTYGVSGEGCTIRENFTIEPLSIQLESTGLIIQCDLKNSDVSIEAVVSGGTPEYTYEWSVGSNDNPLNFTLSPGSYGIKVIDNNNCIEDTNFIIKSIRADCIANIFTPNGDNINDTWNMDDLFLFDDSEVKVFGRFGRMLFESIGYDKPWDGTNMNGSLLPAGVYFYIINIGHGFGSIEGNVTIIR